MVVYDLPRLEFFCKMRDVDGLFERENICGIQLSPIGREFS